MSLDEITFHELVIDRTTRLLENATRTFVVDEARAGLVRPGKLQDDPTTKKINILIHPGGREHPDEIDRARFGDQVYEIGGGHHYNSVFWIRRFKVELVMFFENIRRRSDARIRAHLVLARAMRELMTQDLSEIGADDFGESAWMVEVCQSYLEEGGGDSDLNWRGIMLVEYFTQIDLREP